ncbi:hypothetical protein ACH4U6_36930 [Streptomyces netropsis]|uniref:hypothetical protein n=1 Tax=Streptomyces netropsis TaxID=55404 RepID=UPI0037A2D716
MHLNRRSGGRTLFELFKGEVPRVRRELAEAVPLSEHAARLAAQLTRGLATQVLVRRDGGMTAFYLLDALGRPVCNHGPDRERNDREDKPLRPIRVASVFADPDRGVAAHLEPVPHTPVGGGSGGFRTRRESVEDAAELLIRHYRPAVDGPRVARLWF